MTHTEIKEIRVKSSELQERILHFGWDSLSEEEIAWIFNALEEALKGIEEEKDKQGDGGADWGGGGKPGFNNWL
jgi:hypothetical protein